MAEIVSNTVHKIRWIERIALDQRLTELAVRVGIVVAWHLNRESGVARVGHETLAEKVGKVRRSIDRAVNELVAYGHLEIDRGEPIGQRKDGSAVYGGRGSSSTFRLVSQAVEAPLKSASPESHIRSGESAESASPESHLRRSPSGEKVRLSVHESATQTTGKCDTGVALTHYIDSGSTRQSPSPRPSRERRSFSDRGRYLRELGELIAPNGRGFAFLIDHPDDDRINGLCRKLRNGALSEAELRGLRQEALEGVGRVDAGASETRR